jgi:hemolysin activation/secretion protein
VGSQGEKSTLIGNLYLFGQVTGASGFGYGRAYYTYQEFQGIGYYRLSPDVILAARLKQQATWNWDAYRQLVLDNDYGLRGYTLNKFVGDNRALANLELRMFPDIGWWIFQLSGLAFYDVGAVWSKGELISKTKFHSSAGLGLRIHNKKAAGSQNIIRVDLAFNFDENKFAEIIISSDQLFTAFGKHEFKLPEIYGLEFNNE